MLFKNKASTTPQLSTVKHSHYTAKPFWVPESHETGLLRHNETAELTTIACVEESEHRGTHSLFNGWSCGGYGASPSHP